MRDYLMQKVDLEVMSYMPEERAGESVEDHEGAGANKMDDCLPGLPVLVFRNRERAVIVIVLHQTFVTAPLLMVR